MPAAALIAVRNVSHYYGSGTLRRQILFDVSVDLRPGEIVIVTGPSGSGKTTLLTLVGVLRSTQEGSVTVLGQELRGASEHTLVSVRKRIGYVFQTHNLLASLTARQNVQLALQLHPEISRRQRRVRAEEMLRAVGLGDRLDQRPGQLSGGEKQRVAIARALASQPSVILADEPTASLDRKSGRDVVSLMRDLARRQDCTVLLVTHDNRILDVADRILRLEDGRVSSFSDAVAADTRHLMAMLAQDTCKGELTRRLQELPVDQFVGLLEQVTHQFQQFLQIVDVSNHDAFESMLEQVLEACTLRVGQILQADRATLFLVDGARGQLWSKVAQSSGAKPLEIRIPLGSGVAGYVAAAGVTLNIPDAAREPLFNAEIDRRTGYRTHTILCVPIHDQHRNTFAVAELLNKHGGAPFTGADERQFQEFARLIGIILESWWHMGRRPDGGRVVRESAGADH